MKIPECFENYN